MFCVEDYWNLFLVHLYEAIELYVPKRQIMNNSKKQGIKYPKYIKQMLVRKTATWRLWRNLRQPQLKEKYDRYTIKCRQAIELWNAKREEQLIESADLGKFYRFINNKTSGFKSIPPIYDEVGTLVEDDAVKADVFNRYFSSVFTVDNGKVPFNKSLSKTALNNVSFTPIQVCNFLKKLKAKHSSGPDGLPSMLFKQLADVLCFPLAFIFDASFKAGVLPTCWLDATVSPVFKKGVTSQPENYRPISLTCVCCRIMERIINKEMLDYLYCNRLITPAQHGFLKKTFNLF